MIDVPDLGVMGVHELEHIQPLQGIVSVKQSLCNSCKKLIYRRNSLLLHLLQGLLLYEFLFCKQKTFSPCSSRIKK